MTRESFPNELQFREKKEELLASANMEILKANIVVLDDDQKFRWKKKHNI